MVNNYYTKRYTNRVGVIRVSDTLPLICAAATFKYSYNYYSFIVPALSEFFIMLYNAITLFFLLLYIPLFFKALSRINNRQYKLLKPLLIIPVMVVINTLYVIISTNDLSIISRSYVLALAYGTNDAQGFYFSQVNTWFGNMAVALMIAFYANSKEQIIKCVTSCMLVLIIPTVLIAIIHPSYLGTRQSFFADGSKFGGGLWNIGVVGFGSISWLGLALVDYANKRQKQIIYISTAIFVFVGIAGISRTLILMLVFSGIAFFMFTKKDMSWIIRIMLVLIAMGVFYAIETGLVASLLFRFHDSTSGTQNIRVRLWKAYLSHFKEYWLIGAPLGSVYNYYRDVDLYGAHFLPHSAPLNFFLRYGIISVLSYFVLLKNSFLYILRFPHVEQKSKVCVLCGGIAYITLAFINQTGYAEMVFYIMFGLLLAYTRIESYEELYE